VGGDGCWELSSCLLGTGTGNALGGRDHVLPWAFGQTVGARQQTKWSGGRGSHSHSEPPRTRHPATS